MTAQSYILGSLALGVSIAFAWISENRKWRSQPRENLIKMVYGDDWRRWKMGLRELRRRGEDIDEHLPKLLGTLLNASRLTREAARITLVDIYPGMKEKLKGYRSSDNTAVSESVIASLLAECDRRTHAGDSGVAEAEE